MTKHSLEEIKTTVIELCDRNGYNNDEIKERCLKTIDDYLSLKNSSLDVLFYCLKSSLENNSWLLAWKLIAEETDKLTGKFYERQKEQNDEERRILLDYKPIELGDKILCESDLKHLNVDLGVIDAFGVYHTSKRMGIYINSWPDHRKLAAYLATNNKIFNYYIRVGMMYGKNDGILSAESLSYGDMNVLKNFILNDKMAIALYNGIMSKSGPGLTTFEEKLAFFGDGFGYNSMKSHVYPLIYDEELFNKNINVLSYKLGEKFNRKYFTNILNEK